MSHLVLQKVSPTLLLAAFDVVQFHMMLDGHFAQQLAHSQSPLDEYDKASSCWYGKKYLEQWRALESVRLYNQPVQRFGGISDKSGKACTGVMYRHSFYAFWTTRADYISPHIDRVFCSLTPPRPLSHPKVNRVTG